MSVSKPNAHKKELCLWKDANPKTTQQNVVDKFSEKWGVKIGRSTVSEILKRKDHWLSLSDDVAQHTHSGCSKHTQMYAPGGPISVMTCS